MKNSPSGQSNDDDSQFGELKDLKDPFDDTTVMKLLDTDEQDAVMRSGMSFPEDDEKDAKLTKAAAEPPKTGFARVMDDAGKATVSVLGVGMTVGMAVAPFFLF